MDETSLNAPPEAVDPDDEGSMRRLDLLTPSSVDPATIEPRTRMAILAPKRWKTGRTLKIAFLDGDPTIQERVVDIAKLWNHHANLKFDFGFHSKADIRISFRDSGSWSYIGTDALSIAKANPTMNFGWLTRDSADDEYHRVVLHEFGHALGCIHEHQHPENGIPWRKQEIYDYYGGSPNFWSEAEVDHNFFKRYSKQSTNFSAFDPTSIMMYGFPAEWTEDGFATARNTQLSNMDIAFIQKTYSFG